MKKCLISGLAAATFFCSSLFIREPCAIDTIPCSQSSLKQPINQTEVRKPLIPIIFFHKISENPTHPLTITPEQLYSTLDALYHDNFVSVPLDDIIEQRINIDSGKKPIAITVDDSLTNEKFVEVYSKFYAEHPDFGENATFFICGCKKFFPFNDRNAVCNLMQKYENAGIDVQSHSYFHENWKNADLAFVKKEIETLDGKMMRFGLDKPKYFAFPFGEYPNNKEVNEYLSKRFKACFLADGDFCHYYQIENGTADLVHLSRLEASNLKALQNILKKYEKRIYVQK